MTKDIKHKEDHAPLPFRMDDVQTCTEKFYLFYRRHFDIFDFFFFGVNLATTADKNRMIAAKALASIGTRKHISNLEEVEKNKDITFNKLKEFSSLQSENMLIRSSDNFICYISDIIQGCMRKKPEILKSNEVIKIEDILNFPSMRELISYLVDRKLNEISYGGIKEI